MPDQKSKLRLRTCQVFPYLRHRRHIDDITVPGFEDETLGLGAESRALDGDHGPLVVDSQIKVLSCLDYQRPCLLTEGRMHRDVWDGSEVGTARLIVESLVSFGCSVNKKKYLIQSIFLFYSWARQNSIILLNQRSAREKRRSGVIPIHESISISIQAIHSSSPLESYKKVCTSDVSWRNPTSPKRWPAYSQTINIPSCPHSVDLPKKQVLRHLKVGKRKLQNWSL